MHEVTTERHSARQIAIGRGAITRWYLTNRSETDLRHYTDLEFYFNAEGREVGFHDEAKHLVLHGVPRLWPPRVTETMVGFGIHTFNCCFSAKRRGADGTSSAITLCLECEPDRIEPLIYKDYDHVHFLKVTVDGHPFELPPQRWLGGE